MIVLSRLLWLFLTLNPSQFLIDLLNFCLSCLSPAGSFTKQCKQAFVVFHNTLLPLAFIKQPAALFCYGVNGSLCFFLY